MTRPVSQPKARMRHIIQIREPKPGTLGNMNRSQAGRRAVIYDSSTAPVTDLAAARIRRRKILGGLIHEYERAA